MTLINITGLSKIFSTDELETHALSSLDLQINKGDYVAITGPSGCGKSTLMSLLGLLDIPNGGSYSLNGKNVFDLTSKEAAAIRNLEIGFVFQSFNLISDMTVAQNIALPLSYRSDLSKADRNKLVEEAMERVDIAHRKDHFPNQLSGGQQQRVAIARAVVGSPAIILADEPTGNLDSKNAKIVLDLLDSLNKDGSTICMVTHDPASAARANRVIRMCDGKIESDTPQSLLQSA